MEWPTVDGAVLSFLKRTFGTPLHFDAAFDSDVECAELISQGFPDMVEETACNIAAEIMLWKAGASRDLKRARKSVAEKALFGLPLESQVSVQSAFKQISQTSPLILLELHAKKAQRKHEEEPPDIRSKQFDAERKKYSLLLAQVIIDASLPVVPLVQTLEDPRTGWIHLFAARRGNTLKNRYKVWHPFEIWLELHRGYKFPKSIRDVIDYMQHRVDEGCGRTVPESFSVALSMLEQLGRVPEDSRLSEDALWKGHVKSWVAELGVDAPPRKPAEMYTVAMLISLEALVTDEEAAIFARALAWVVLCMVWGAMRCDDVQSILPHRMILSNFGLSLTLGRSKTSGPDKPQKELVVHILRTVSLTGRDWLRVGMDIWEEDPFNFKRDYLVMEPTRFWDGVRRKNVPPSGLASLISCLLSQLGTPKAVFQSWDVTPNQLLLPDGLEKFFTGHSPRNFMTSVAAVIGFSRDERAFLGRWSMGTVSAEEYVRTSRQVVFKIQRAVNRTLIEGGPEEFFEDELIDKLCKFAEDQGANPSRIAKRHRVLSIVSGRNCLGGVYPALEVEARDAELVSDFLDEDHEESVDRIAQKELSLVEKQSKYFVIVSRRAGLKRLHMSGCHVKPSRCLEVLYLDAVDSGDFDSICRSCKRRMLAESGKDHQESSSTASSTSTDSS